MKFSSSYFLFLARFFRCLATQAAATKTKSSNVEKKTDEKAAKESQSFTMNIFRGQLVTSQVFPFPEPLMEEQRETLSMLVDPVSKFFEVN